MAYSGWRFSCDRGTLERCAGSLEIRAKEIGDVDPGGATYLMGAAASLRAIVADGDGIDPAEFVGQVMARTGAE